MKDNTILTIRDPQAAMKFLDAWDMRMNEKIWRQMGITMERAKNIIATVPANLPWYEVERNYSRHQAEQFLKHHTIDTDQVSDIVFAGIDHKDYPEYCDTYISDARYHGIPMLESQLDVLNEEHKEFMYEKLMSHLF